MTTRYFRWCPASWLRRLRLMGPPGLCARPMRYVARRSMLPRAAGRRQGTVTAENPPSPFDPTRSTVDKPDDILDGLHRFRGDLLRARRAVGEYRVDRCRVSQQALELVAHRART